MPLELDSLFSGEYSGNRQELIDGSYLLGENLVAFMYTNIFEEKSANLLLKYSNDQGETWHDSVVPESFPPMRYRKIDFLNEVFGYIIISGERTMSQEYARVFLTHDGGETWQATPELERTSLIAFAGFVDERTGFLSYGTINPTEPDVYVTQDGGETWNQATFHRPIEYEEIFVQAEVPVKEGDDLTVLVNQGPNGDYLGGRVKGKFISKDNGLTWDFLGEVEPDEAE